MSCDEDAMEEQAFSSSSLVMWRGVAWCDMMRCDVDAMEEQAFSSSSPFWRTADYGLNVEGKCSNTKCHIYGYLVIDRRVRLTRLQLHACMLCAWLVIARPAGRSWPCPATRSLLWAPDPLQLLICLLHNSLAGAYLLQCSAVVASHAWSTHNAMSIPAACHSCRQHLCRALAASTC